MGEMFSIGVRSARGEAVEAAEAVDAHQPQRSHSRRRILVLRLFMTPVSLSLSITDDLHSLHPFTGSELRGATWLLVCFFV